MEAATRLAVRDTMRLCGIHILSTIACQALIEGVRPMKEPIMDVFRGLTDTVLQKLDEMMPDILAHVMKGHAQVIANYYESQKQN
jgi:hypothetical protein